MFWSVITVYRGELKVLHAYIRIWLVGIYQPWLQPLVPLLFFLQLWPLLAFMALNLPRQVCEQFKFSEQWTNSNRELNVTRDLEWDQHSCCFSSFYSHPQLCQLKNNELPSSGATCRLLLWSWERKWYWVRRGNTNGFPNTCKSQINSLSFWQRTKSTVHLFWVPQQYERERSSAGR